MTKPMNNVISLLGVQGLSRNNYSVVQLKVVLAIVGHAQKVINDYVVDEEMSNRSMRKYLTPSQLGYHQRCQYFSSKMVQLIYHFLGEPG